MTRRVAAILVLAFAVLALVVGCGDDESKGPLPKDFPSKQVPLIDGTVQSGHGENQTWSVTVQGKAGAKSVDEAIKKLADAGYDDTGSNTTGGVTSFVRSATKDGRFFTVTVAAQPNSGPNAVLYIVTRS